MSLPLEDEIMAEIGLGQHFSWFNGSGSCLYIRQDAANKLGDVLRKYADAGKVFEPDGAVLGAVRCVAMCEKTDYLLTKTWQACATAIRAHMDAVGGGARCLVDAERYIRDTFVDRSVPSYYRF
jgi:hypothetical protein